MATARMCNWLASVEELSPQSQTRDFKKIQEGKRRPKKIPEDLAPWLDQRRRRETLGHRLRASLHHGPVAPAAGSAILNFPVEE